MSIHVIENQKCVVKKFGSNVLNYISATLFNYTVIIYV